MHPGRSKPGEVVAGAEDGDRVGKVAREKMETTLVLDDEESGDIEISGGEVRGTHSHPGKGQRAGAFPAEPDEKQPMILILPRIEKDLETLPTAFAVVAEIEQAHEETAMTFEELAVDPGEGKGTKGTAVGAARLKLLREPDRRDHLLKRFVFPERPFPDERDVEDEVGGREKGQKGFVLSPRARRATL